MHAKFWRGRESGRLKGLYSHFVFIWCGMFCRLHYVRAVLRGHLEEVRNKNEPRTGSFSKRCIFVVRKFMGDRLDTPGAEAVHRDMAVP